MSAKVLGTNELDLEALRWGVLSRIWDYRVARDAYLNEAQFKDAVHLMREEVGELVVELGHGFFAAQFEEGRGGVVFPVLVEGGAVLGAALTAELVADAGYLALLEEGRRWRELPVLVFGKEVGTLGGRTETGVFPRVEEVDGGGDLGRWKVIATVDVVEGEKPMISVWARPVEGKAPRSDREFRIDWSSTDSVGSVLDITEKVKVCMRGCAALDRQKLLCWEAIAHSGNTGGRWYGVNSKVRAEVALTDEGIWGLDKWVGRDERGRELWGISFEYFSCIGGVKVWDAQVIGIEMISKKWGRWATEPDAPTMVRRLLELLESRRWMLMSC